MTDFNPVVSIITPSFNQVAFLEQTILSVLNQTYSNIEYIIIDGGSTDGSIEIIQKYSNKLAYWVSEKDNGQTHAINKGLQKSKGKIIAYLNADDLLENDAVENVVVEFFKHPEAALVYGCCATIGETGNLIRNHEGSQIHFSSFVRKGMLPNIFQPACFFNFQKIKRRPLFKQNLNYTMDYELILFLLQQKQQIIFVNKPFAKYRVHAGAKTTAQSKKLYLEKLKVQLRYANYLFPLIAYRWIKAQLSYL